MSWLLEKFPTLHGPSWQLGDATQMIWKDSEFAPDLMDAKRVPLKFDAIATETYLGRPFSVLPDSDVLRHVIQDVDTIHKKFLQNVRLQTKAGFRMCLAVPAWKTPIGFMHLPILDHLEELGYTRISFTHVKNGDLIYHRPNQIVGRELVVLIRN